MRLRLALPLSIALGAATTVSAAWLCAAYFPIEGDTGSGLVAASGGTWRLHVIYGIGGEEADWTGVELLPADFDGAQTERVLEGYRLRAAPSGATRTLREAPAWTRLGQARDPEFMRHAGFSVDRGYGLPWIAIRCTLGNVETGGTRQVIDGIALLPRTLALGPKSLITTARTRALPVRIVWPGFLADAATFAVVWFACLNGPAWWRRYRVHRRIRLGLCPRCAYDLRGVAGPVCPECNWERSQNASAQRAC